MFLNRMFIFCVFSFGFAVTSWATAPVTSAVLPGLEVGQYVLSEGPEKLCRGFQIGSSDLKKKKIAVGGHYTLLVSNSRKQVESDLEPTCEFIEETSKEAGASDSTLTRSNAEVCGQVTKLKTTSKVNFRGDKIFLDHTIVKEAQTHSYTCVWLRQR